MSSIYGEKIKVSIFGQSHSQAIGVTVDGLPAGKKIDAEKLSRFMQRRAPGRNALSTQRKEQDTPEFLCGLIDGTTCGAPLTAIIKNSDIKPGDYDNLRFTPRPGHADYTASVKYNGFQDPTGGGHFSGRLTAPLCIAGGIIIQLLEEKNIKIISRIYSIGDIKDDGELTESLEEKDFPTVSDEKGKLMRELIESVKKDGDSVGGIIECSVLGIPCGIGDPMFDGMENRIAKAIFAIPAVKGIEFGAGFSASLMKGSENNDAFAIKDGKIITETNNCGGILGGITTGMPLTFRAAFKPTPSISLPQKTVDLRLNKETEIMIKGRHDPCVAVRAVPCVEAAAAIAVYDALM
ncbi:MAG: chorismate synthase [Clostridia bacterium]|nr:chorismate synthase [Clostridia bacterium]